VSTSDISKFTPNSEITIYETEDGKVRVDVHFKNENLWLSQKLMAELFECSTDNISLHLKNIYSEGELDETATTEEFSVVRQEGKRQVKRNLIFYSLEAIIAVGYRVNSTRGTQFRVWATEKLKNYILKGFAIDVNRFKYGTRFDARYFEELLEEGVWFVCLDGPGDRDPRPLFELVCPYRLHRTSFQAE